MEISYNALCLLNHTLLYTGEKEYDPIKKVEVHSSRRLNAEDSSQRRHFTKLFDPINTTATKGIQELADNYNDSVKDCRKALEEASPKKEEENDGQFELRIIQMLKEDENLKKKLEETQSKTSDLMIGKHTVELTDKTKAVCKKALNDFGESNGFAPADDDLMEELNTVLA